MTSNLNITISNINLNLRPKINGIVTCNLKYNSVRIDENNLLNNSVLDMFRLFAGLINRLFHHSKELQYNSFNRSSFPSKVDTHGCCTTQ